MNYLNLPQPESFPHKVKVLIEIPKGSYNKYEYNLEDGVIELDRVLHSPFFYPVDYGFLPQTKGEDGDPLDAMVLTDSPTFPGVLVEAVPIGLFLMEDEEGIDHKILSVPAKNPHFNFIQDLSQVPKHYLDEIAHFFQEYKKLEGGKFSKVKGWEGKDKALELLKEARQRFLQDQ